MQTCKLSIAHCADPLFIILSNLTTVAPDDLAAVQHLLFGDSTEDLSDAEENRP
jgi:hypothetical protein